MNEKIKKMEALIWIIADTMDISSIQVAQKFLESDIHSYEDFCKKIEKEASI